MRRFAQMNLQTTTELDGKLSYTPCYVQVWLIKVEYLIEELNKNFKRKINIQIMGNIVKKFENFKDGLYVTCKNSPEDNYQLHNKKDYLVIKYDNQPYGVGRLTILNPSSGKEETYPKTMFSEPFNK